MDDFKKQLEQAKLARMQGIKISGVPPRAAPNRIEEALRANVPTIKPPVSAARPEISPRPEPAAPVAAPATRGHYGSFLKKFFFALFIIVLAAGGWYGYKFYRAHPQEATAADVIAKVGKLVELPAGETPTVATISDLKPLANEVFFKDAEIGDKVLIFATSSEAVLYRPSTNKVIRVSPLSQQ